MVVMLMYSATAHRTIDIVLYLYMISMHRTFPFGMRYILQRGVANRPRDLRRTETNSDASMLSQIQKKFRSLFGDKDRRELGGTTKRHLERDEEGPAKRIKHEHEHQQAQWIPYLSFAKMADWVLKCKSSFADNFYVRPVTSESTAANTAQDTMAANAPWPSAVSKRNPIHAPVKAPATPLSQYPHGYNFNRARQDIQDDRPFQFATEGVMEFKAPRTLTSTSVTVSKATAFPGPKSGRAPMGGLVNDVHREGQGRSIYEKTFNRGRTSYRDIRNRNGLAARETIRLDERNRYAQLLQQFTSIPVSSGAAFRCSSVTQTGNTTHNTEDQSILGSAVVDLTESNQTGRPLVSDTPSTIKMQPLKSSTPAAVCHPAFSERSFVELQQRRAESNVSSYTTAREQGRKVVGDIISVDLTSDEPTTTSKAEAGRWRMQTSIPERPESPEIISISSPVSSRRSSSSGFFNSLQESEYIKDDWLQELTGKYSPSVRKNERAVKEQETKLQYFKEQRAEWDEQLETRIRNRLIISKREPAAVEEDYEEEESESEEEEQEDEFPELSDEAESLVARALRPHPPDEVLVNAFKLQLSRKDISTLAGLNWLNDEVINFYMNMLVDRGSQQGKPTVHAFNTFFYPKLMSSGHAGVRRWTRKIDVFSMDYILVPVHLGMHWCLAAVDLPRKAINYYDSMGGRNQGCLNALRQYLAEESMDKRKQTMDMSGWTLTIVKDIPQQMNGSDCGMFACMFAEYITRGANITFSQEHMPYFRTRMVFEILQKKLML